MVGNVQQVYSGDVRAHKREQSHIWLKYQVRIHAPIVMAIRTTHAVPAIRNATVSPMRTNPSKAKCTHSRAHPTKHAS